MNLSTVYKTYDGARKRCGFENGIARGEFERGDKARHYRYAVVSASDGTWRIARAEQHVLPGCEAVSDSTMAQRGSNAPLLPKTAQEPIGTLGGLFGDERKQLDLIDAIRRTP